VVLTEAINSRILGNSPRNYREMGFEKISLLRIATGPQSACLGVYLALELDRTWTENAISVGCRDSDE